MKVVVVVKCVPALLYNGLYTYKNKGRFDVKQLAVSLGYFRSDLTHMRGRRCSKYAPFV